MEVGVSASAPLHAPATDEQREPLPADARDAGRASANDSVDLRSPDARDAGRAAVSSANVDLRSPDARDAGRVTSTPSPASVPSSDAGGTAWDDVGIVGGLLGLVLIGLGAAFLLLRRRTARTAAVSS